MDLPSTSWCFWPRAAPLNMPNTLAHHCQRHGRPPRQGNKRAWINPHFFFKGVDHHPVAQKAPIIQDNHFVYAQLHLDACTPPLHHLVRPPGGLAIRLCIACHGFFGCPFSSPLCWKRFEPTRRQNHIIFLTTIQWPRRLP